MYALNIKKGTTINHPAVGKLVGGIAVEVDEREANQVKNLYNIVVFEDVLKKKED